MMSKGEKEEGLKQQGHKSTGNQSLLVAGRGTTYCLGFFFSFSFNSAHGLKL